MEKKAILADLVVGEVGERKVAMKTFVCSHCANKIYFENAECVKCGHALGFDARTLQFAAIEADKAGGGLYRRVDGKDATRVRYCANAAHGVCNWLTGEKDPNALCPACDLNRTIPNLAENGSLAVGASWSGRRSGLFIRCCGSICRLKPRPPTRGL